MRELLELILIFARIGAVTFGGGYAMLPILRRELVEKRGWTTDEELMDYYAIGQCTPGIIAVNTATFIGLKRKGIPGGIAATIGIVLPSIVIISIIAAFINNFAEYAVVRNAFAGIRVCVCVLIVSAVVKLWKKSVTDALTLAIFVIVFLVSVFFDVSPVLLVLISAAVGILLQAAKAVKAK